MSDFDTTKHPRGHASNPGAFSDKENSAPELLLRPVPHGRRSGINGTVPIVGDPVWYIDEPASVVRVDGGDGDDATFMVELTDGSLALATGRELWMRKRKAGSAPALLNDVTGGEDRLVRDQAIRNIGTQATALTRTQSDEMGALFIADAIRVYGASAALGRVALEGDTGADAGGNGPRTWIAALTARALNARHLIGAQHGWTQEAYDTITRPWRSVIGPIHPDDEAIPASWSAAAAVLPDDPYLNLADAIRGN